MPAVVPIENREPQTATVYAADDHVTVSVSNLCAFRFQVYDVEGGVEHRLLHVSISGNIHIAPLDSETMRPHEAA